jgi:hypothetical protein
VVASGVLWLSLLLDFKGVVVIFICTLLPLVSGE